MKIIIRNKRPLGDCLAELTIIAFLWSKSGLSWWLFAGIILIGTVLNLAFPNKETP